MEAFTTDLRAGPRPAAFSTVQTYQTTLRLFVEYVTDPRYGWLRECQQRFGAVPTQICHEWNTVTHSAEFEGRPPDRVSSAEDLPPLKCGDLIHAALMPSPLEGGDEPGVCDQLSQRRRDHLGADHEYVGVVVSPGDLRCE